MPACEKCHATAKRRRLCWHCGKFVCGYCWHHECQCAPGHTKAGCRDYKSFRNWGRQWINRLRARQGLKLLPEPNPFKGIAAYYANPKTRVTPTP